MTTHDLQQPHSVVQMSNLSVLDGIPRCHCGHILRDPESVKRGMGPTCWKKEQYYRVRKIFVEYGLDVELNYIDIKEFTNDLREVFTK